MDEKVSEAIQETMKGGAIRKVRKKSPKKDIKIEEALAAKMQGGAIRKHKKKSPKKDPKMIKKYTKKGAVKNREMRTDFHSSAQSG